MGLGNLPKSHRVAKCLRRFVTALLFKGVRASDGHRSDPGHLGFRGYPWYFVVADNFCGRLGLS
jgi:hypothetical protein